MDSEQRRAKRYEGALPVEIDRATGMTRDFSVSGLFFETDKSFIPGQTIDFIVKLEHLSPDGSPINMKCHGKIVRIDEKGGKIGVATEIISYSLESVPK